MRLGSTPFRGLSRETPASCANGCLTSDLFLWRWTRLKNKSEITHLSDTPTRFGLLTLSFHPTSEKSHAWCEDVKSVKMHFRVVKQRHSCRCSKHVIEVDPASERGLLQTEAGGSHGHAEGGWGVCCRIVTTTLPPITRPQTWPLLFTVRKISVAISRNERAKITTTLICKEEINRKYFCCSINGKMCPSSKKKDL